ncbi:MAG: hypothetical protein RL095_2845 [Verrucomicrobiota bacterium]|jgi:large subunit ribosomal protein L28
MSNASTVQRPGDVNFKKGDHKPNKRCFYCGKHSVSGGVITHRGISKKSGGIGLKLVKTNIRLFKANLQKIKIKHNGVVSSEWVCTGCIRSGSVTK